MKAVRESLLLISLLLLPAISFAQSTDTQSTPSPTPSRGGNFGKSLVRDQKAIWTSPFRLKKHDAHWLLPFALTTAGLIVADRHVTGFVDRNGSLQPVSHKVSLLGSGYTVAGTAAGLYLIGHATHNARERQTGRLMTEALIGTTVVTEILKLATERRRPNVANGNGRFFTNGRSFPSGHSSSAWAVATVLALQYKHNAWIKYGAFATAVAVGLSRFSGRNHFLSDVLTGSAIGYGVGRFVYNNR